MNHEILQQAKHAAIRPAVMGATALSLLAFDAENSVAHPEERPEVPKQNLMDSSYSLENAADRYRDNEPAARTAGKLSCRPDKSDVGYDRCLWKIRRVDNLKGRRLGRWRYCLGFEKSKTAQSATCELSNGKSNTVRTDVGGKIADGIGYGELSASVGYSVTKTTFVNKSYTSGASKMGGEIHWAAVFGSRKRVVQENQLCTAISPGRYKFCERARRPSRKNIKYAYTWRYLGVKFRPFIIKKDNRKKAS